MNPPVDPVDWGDQQRRKIAAAPIADEDAAQETLCFVMANVRANNRHPSRRPRDVAEGIYGNSKDRYARSILLGAHTLSLGLKALDTTKILNSLRAVERCHPDDHEAEAEQWERIEDIAREKARECREYAGDAQ